ncbi:MAG: ACP S-malonyltransferase [Boseongicola sp.]|nr:ACP S-malonyltransferase [Boseongicola sp.]MDD9978525.1 ACP S-malonyltransferase [Boseongicola sp.]
MKTAVVICPGRGTYNSTELGYLSRHFPDAGLLDRFDKIRQQNDQDAVSSLDRVERYSLSKHGRGDNASALIYAATLGDFLSIGDQIDVVAVTGNSMGWYSALACGGAVSAEDGFLIANTMGTMMQSAMIGGQIIHPWVDDDWVPRPEVRETLMGMVDQINGQGDAILTLSIDLGGMLVLAGNETGLSAFEAAVEPVGDRFPMRLANHAAFHSHLQTSVANQGREALSPMLFGPPKKPLIDGRGEIWWPGSSTREDLYEYTLGHQVTETYDFTHAVTVAAREFAPDLFIVTGPGTTLGGAVAQSLIRANWNGMTDKADFKARQAAEAFLISMGMEDQRKLVASL